MISLRVPRPPSTKNSRKVIRVAGRTRTVPSTAAERSKAAFRAALLEQLGRIPREPILGDRNVAVRAEHLVDTDELLIEFEDRGPRPKGKTGRRSDLQNLLEGPLDWAQGLVYVDDNQVVEVDLRRVL